MFVWDFCAWVSCIEICNIYIWTAYLQMRFVHEFHCKWTQWYIYIYIYIYVQLLIFMYNCWYIYLYIWRVLTFNDWSTSSQKKKKKTLARLVHIMNITKTLVSRDYLSQDNNLIGLKRKRTTIWLDFGKCIILFSKKKIR